MERLSSKEDAERMLREFGKEITYNELLDVVRGVIASGAYTLVGDEFALLSERSPVFLFWSTFSSDRFGRCSCYIPGTGKLYVESWGTDGVEGTSILDQSTQVENFLCYHYQNGR